MNNNSLITNSIILGLGVYILVYQINWHQPKTFDWIIIISYSICLVLLIVNMILKAIIRRKKDE